MPHNPSARRNAPWRSRRGITLVELICTLAVALIIGAFIGRAVTSAGSQYSDLNAAERAKIAVDTMEVSLDNTLRYAKKASVSDYTLPAGIYSSDGILCALDGSDFFAGTPGIYDGLYYEVSFTPQAKNSVLILLTVRENASSYILYEDAYTLHFLNAELPADSDASPVLYYEAAD